MKKIQALMILFTLIFSIINIFSTKVFASEINMDALTQGELVLYIDNDEDEQINIPTIKEKKKVISIPLKHTSVIGEISGFVSRTTVIQEFHNPYENTIEAIYSFPLPNEASVDYMEMKIGERTIIGEIKKREEAKKIYEQAKKDGKTASILNQERPNIFTQQIANIQPGDNIKITISYFEVLKYEGGKYTYNFPMVVGPRYNPESVTDVENISAPTISKGNRNGHTIDLELKINSGVNIKDLKSLSHEVNIEEISKKESLVKLKNNEEIPNKDFIFTYDVTSNEPQVGFITHRNKYADHGYFTLIAEPQKSPTQDQIRNKEIIFVLDTSGSMGGKPINALIATMKKAINDLGENDYFNIYGFNSSTTTVFDKAVKATEENKKEGLAYVNKIRAGGGTVMDTPLRNALKVSGENEDRIRVLLILTDGDIGNESQLIDLVTNNIGQNRIFTLGVDYAPNRYLLDRLSEAGNGKTTYILPHEDPTEKVNEFYDTFKSPVLTDIRVDWDGLEVYDILPSKFSDLYAGQPLYVYGKYRGGSDIPKNIKITGYKGNKEYTETIPVEFKKENSQNSSLAGLWARKKVKDLYSQNYFSRNNNLENEITELGLTYSIMTKFTSFIAVDQTIRGTNGEKETIKVPKYNVEGKEKNKSNLLESAPIEIVSDSFFTDEEDSAMAINQEDLSVNKNTLTNSISPSPKYKRTGGGINFGGEKVDSGLVGSHASADIAGEKLIRNIFTLLYLITFILGIILFIKSSITANNEKDEEKRKELKNKAKKIIFKTIMWLFIIWILGSVVEWVIVKVLTPAAG